MDLFSEFKHLDKFTLSEAGFLLCNHAPLPIWWPKHGNDSHEAIRKKADMTAKGLEYDARHGALKVFDNSGNQIKFRKDRFTDEEYRIEHNGRGLMYLRGCTPRDRWFVMRHDLEEWANARGIKPAFLFPEESKTQQNEPIANAKSTIMLTNKIGSQESGDDCFSEEECAYFDPLTKKQIAKLFGLISDEDWKKNFERAKRNPGLASARHGGKPYKYNPAKVANWLYRKGKYRADHLAKILSKNLPARSVEHRESFLECRGLLDEN